MRHRHRQPRDSGRRRWADAARPYRAALERFGEGRRLYAYVIALHLPAGTPLHSEEASRAARQVVASVFGSAPARWKLERGRGGALHVHVVTPLPPVAVHEFEHVERVWNLRGLLAYLAKPGDARLCRNRLFPWSPDVMTRRREMFAAMDDEAAARRDRLARGKRTLPPVQGWTGRGTKPGQSDTAVFLLACRLHVLALAALLAVSAPESADPTPTPRPARRERPRPAQRRPRPRAPDRPTSGPRL